MIQQFPIIFFLSCRRRSLAGKTILLFLMIWSPRVKPQKSNNDDLNPNAVKKWRPWKKTNKKIRKWYREKKNKKKMFQSRPGLV